MAITLDGTTGITTPGLTNTGTETIVSLTTTGNTILGDASTDTLNVGNGGLCKDATGKVGIGTTAPAKPLNVVTSATTEVWVESTSTQKAILSLSAGDTSVGFSSTYNTGGTAARPFIFYNISTPLLQFDLGKSVALQGANPQTGAGITFPATQSASSDANTLDDYEEGTWTPTVTATTGSYTTYTSSGSYTKVGRLVTMTSYFVVSNKGTGSGVAKLTNIPFGAATLSSGSYTSSGINENTGNITCAQLYNATPTTAYIGTATGGDPVTVNQGMSTSFTFYTS